MTRRYTEGTKVEWDWDESEGQGLVSETFTRDVTRIIKGAEVVRHASEDTPAYLIEQDDGARVLKSHTEVRKSF